MRSCVVRLRLSGGLLPCLNDTRKPHEGNKYVNDVTLNEF